MEDVTPTTAKRGRPKKGLVASKKSRGVVGRPKGDAAIINEYKARMLASPKSRKVMETIFDAALDNEHKNQAAAWKLLMDRMLPVSAFESEFKQTSGKSAIQINISGLGGDVSIGGHNSESDTEEVSDFLEGDFEEYDQAP